MRNMSREEIALILLQAVLAGGRFPNDEFVGEMFDRVDLYTAEYIKRYKQKPNSIPFSALNNRRDDQNE